MFGNYVLSTSFTPYHAWPGPVASSVTPMDSRCRKISKNVSFEFFSSFLKIMNFHAKNLKISYDLDKALLEML